MLRTIAVCMFVLAGCGGQEVIVPAEVTNARVFVESRINGSAPLPFLLDTGASESVLNEDRLAELGLRGGSSGSAPVEGGAMETRVVPAVTLAVGDLTLPVRAVTALPLHGVEAGLGHRVYGILGSELFSVRVVTIDYGQRTVRLGSSAPDPKSAIPISLEESTPIATASVDGVSGRFQIDTGGGMTVVNAPFLAAHPTLVPKTIFQTSSGAIIPGASRGGVGRAGLLQIGTIRIERPIVNYSQNTSGDRIDIDAGLIGGEVLSRFTVTLDYRSGLLWLEPNTSFGSPFEFTGSGLSLAAEGPALEIVRVRSVIAESPAAEADIRVGDRIVSVDGREHSLEEARRLLNDVFRTSDLVIERQGVRLKKHLTQRRLL
jgi:hypothetical protein